MAISSIGNQPHNLHIKYIHGSGVGASSVSTRRLRQQRAASCYPQPGTVYLRVSDIATYDIALSRWILNGNTVITSWQYLTIYETEDLHIPFYMTFTNNGEVMNKGSFHMEYDDINGSTVYNTGKFYNYGSIEVNDYCSFYTYGGGSLFNSSYVAPNPEANIAVSGIFAFPPDVGSTCGSGTFTGKTELLVGSISYTCPI